MGREKGWKFVQSTCSQGYPREHLSLSACWRSRRSNTNSSCLGLKSSQIGGVSPAILILCPSWRKAGKWTEKLLSDGQGKSEPMVYLLHLLCYRGRTWSCFQGSRHLQAGLEADGVRAACGVLNSRTEWCCHSPLIPHHLGIAASPETHTGGLAFTHGNGLLNGKEDGKPWKHLRRVSLWTDTQSDVLIKHSLKVACKPIAALCSPPRGTPRCSSGCCQSWDLCWDGWR